MRELVDEAGTGEPFRLILAAEGTRSKGEYWKSGFLRLSKETGLPITLAFFDPPTKTMGFGPTFHASDDVTRRHGHRPGVLRRQARHPAQERDSTRACAKKTDPLSSAGGRGQQGVDDQARPVQQLAVRLAACRRSAAVLGRGISATSAATL